jgi:hypothetical protein
MPKKKFPLPTTMSKKATIEAFSKKQEGEAKRSFKRLKAQFKIAKTKKERRSVLSELKAYKWFRSEDFRHFLTKSEYNNALKVINSCSHKGKRKTLINRLEANSGSMFKRTDIFPLPMVKYLLKAQEK